MRLAGERGGEGANLSMCSRPRGLYKARVSDLLELAKIARELAAAFRQSPRRHGDRKRRRGHRVWSRGVHGHRPHYAARGRRLRIRGLLETLGGRRRQERRGDAEPRRGGDARWPWNDRSFRKAFAIQAPSQRSVTHQIEKGKGSRFHVKGPLINTYSMNLMNILRRGKGDAMVKER
ncbi:protein ripply2 isoform X1 [Macaca nemestrina]|uniref:protein ripply2 isoform X1 n=1 Tax=Macaca nemestrina TaxID=9545 RepID=UPI0039B9BC23